MRPIRNLAFKAALAAAALAAPAAAQDDDSMHLRLSETETATGNQIEIDDYRLLPGLWEENGKLKGGSTGVLAIVMPAGECHGGKKYRSAEVAAWDHVVTLTDLKLLGCSPARASRGRSMQTVSFGYTTATIEYR